jgi:hypothetical protein
MKLTVIGLGRIGSQVVKKLTSAGHEVVPASLSTGVDLLTGKGLDQALKGAEVVVNLTNSPTFDEASLDFFRTTMSNILAAGKEAGVRHQVILSIVGVDQAPQLAYYRGKALQEELLRKGPTPFSIVRATQSKSPPASRSEGSGTSPARMFSRSTRSAGSPWPRTTTGGPSSPTTRPACSETSPVTCSPPAPTRTWPPRTTRTG